MLTKCPICPKQFPSKSGLKNHTGTADPNLRKPHVCRDCDKTFCSQKAMEQHRDTSVQETVFKCDVCRKGFKSKQAVAQHRRSSLHVGMPAPAKPPVRFVVGSTLSTGNVRSYGSEYCLGSNINYRIHLPETNLVHPQCPLFYTETVRVAVATQTTTTTTTMMMMMMMMTTAMLTQITLVYTIHEQTIPGRETIPRQTILGQVGATIRTGGFVIVTAGGVDIVLMASTSEFSRVPFGERRGSFEVKRKRVLKRSDVDGSPEQT
jgi:hypothetical protein